MVAVENDALIHAVIWESRLTMALPSYSQQICLGHHLVSEREKGIEVSLWGVISQGWKGHQLLLFTLCCLECSHMTTPTCKAAEKCNVTASQEEEKKVYNNYLPVCTTGWHGPLSVLRSSLWKQ